VKLEFDFVHFRLPAVGNDSTQQDHRHGP
jgi:hypothetical protein